MSSTTEISLKHLIIRRICEKDDASTRSMILVVTEISKQDIQVYNLQFTLKQ